MRPTFLRISIVCSLALAAPALAHAAPGAPGDVATDKARELHIEGDAFYKKGDYARARVSYIAAWALKRHWQLAGSLGDCEVKLGMNRDAAEHLAYFMRVSPNQPPSSDAQKLFQTASSKIGTLVVTVDVPGAEVAVDGKVVGKAPLEDPVFVEPGHHTLEAHLGTKVMAAEVDVAAGGKRTVGLTLTGPDPIIITGSVITGVVLVTGIGLLAGSVAKGSSAKSQEATIASSGQTCVAGFADPRCDALHSTAATGDAMNRAGIGLLVGAGVVGVGTLTYALVGRRNTPAPRSGSVRLTPALAPGFSGLSFSGTF